MCLAQHVSCSLKQEYTQQQYSENEASPKQRRVNFSSFPELVQNRYPSKPKSSYKKHRDWKGNELKRHEQAIVPFLLIGSSVSGRIRCIIAFDLQQLLMVW
jgi:hypothetical protein